VLIKKTALAIFCMASMASCYAATATSDNSIDYGIVPYSAPVGSISAPYTLTVSCTAGQTLKIEPNAGSNGFLILSLTREGVANGSASQYFLNSGTVMKSSAPASLINTTCTGSAQIFNLTAVLSGSTTPGSLAAFNKAGIMSFSGRFMKVTVGGVSTLTPSQTINGEIKGLCAANVGDFPLGIIPSPTSATSYTIKTVLTSRCDSGLSGTAAIDSDGTTWTLGGGLCTDVFSPPRPDNPAKACFTIKQFGATNPVNIGVTNNLYPFVGTGDWVSYELAATVTIPANTSGEVNKVLNIKLRY